MKKKLLFLLKLLLGIILIGWLVWRTDWHEVLAHLSHISWILVLAYVVLQLLATLLSAQKWRIISRYKDIRFSLWDGFWAYMTGSLINNFFPSIIGGDAYRALWLKDRAPSKAVAFSTVVFDRFIGLWMLLLLALLSSLFLVPMLSRLFPQSLVWGIFAGLLACYALGTALYRTQWFQRLLLRVPWQGAKHFFAEVAMYSQGAIWTRTALWSAAFIFVGIGLANYVLFQAVAGHISFFAYFGAIFWIAFLSNVPITINNIGVKEWAYVTVFGLVGIDPEAALTVALISRVIQMFLSFGALPYYLADRKKSKSLAD